MSPENIVHGLRMGRSYRECLGFQSGMIISPIRKFVSRRIFVIKRTLANVASQPIGILRQVRF